ncbi:hypothetical protein GCM10025876_25250 [Demequina litorisediminis]|uniref:Uncharacterized protein n=1 Tax=Demequina litorisediminis TaxID=1849022 RepID=A0ABQ6IFW9_9MICO|nr:hypothetical protein GCM10025876_25250 [Demequina litorisediminis]
MRGRHRSDVDGAHLAIEQRGVTGDERAVDGLHQGTQQRCREDGVLRQRAHADVGRQRLPDRLEARRLAAVSEDRGHAGVIFLKFRAGLPHHASDLRRCAVAAMDHERHGRAEVRGDARVERELRGA